MLQAVGTAGSGRPAKRSHDVTFSPASPAPPKLDELGISKMQSSRWQKLAAVPEDAFESYIETAKADEKADITAVGLAQHAARQHQPDAVAEPIPPREGRYRVIVIDPPWPMKKIERSERPNQGVELDYPVLSLEQIADEEIVPVRTHADDDCHIYLWVTHKYLPAGLDLLEAWGFHYQCVMTWRKNVGITPFSWMYDTEHVLFGTKGNLSLERKGLRLSFEAKVVGHSVKPDIFYERVLEASAGPRIEMFARRERDGFTTWGNEVTV
jgi:N6-adenosine-specific RNA methylase IME4